MYRNRQQIGGYQRAGKGVEGTEKWVKGLSRMLTYGNQTFGGEHNIIHTDIDL